jgi:hypothetical protein
MFTKLCLVSIVALLVAMLLSQRSLEVVRAQAGIEYKAVQVEVFLTPDGQTTTGGVNAKYYTTQDALNEYGKSGWQLVTASYDHETGPRSGQLIFMKK